MCNIYLSSPDECEHGKVKQQNGIAVISEIILQSLTVSFSYKFLFFLFNITAVVRRPWLQRAGSWHLKWRILSVFVVIIFK